MTDARDIKAVLEALDKAGLVKSGGIVEHLGGNAAALDRLVAVTSLLRSDAGATAKLGLLLETLEKAGIVKPAAGLTPVNAALGETVGKALDGKKTVIGTVAMLATTLLPAIAPAIPALAPVAGAVSAAAPVVIPIASALTGWGVLGKLDKWMHKPAAAEIGDVLKRLADR